MPSVPQLAATREELNRVLANAQFVGHYDFQLESFGPGECTLVFPYNAVFDRPGGVVSGPVYMTIAGVAMWLAIMTRLGTDVGELALMTDCSTTFLASAKAESFRCTARILKLGGGGIYGTAECRTADGKLLAHHTVSYTNPATRVLAPRSNVVH